MQFHARQFRFIVGFFAILAIIWIAGEFAAFWPTLLPGDKGTWLGGIGTVGTLLGTIWIVTSDNRRHRKKDIELAKLAASGLRFRLSEVKKVVECFDRDILEIRAKGQTPNYDAYVQRLEVTGYWTKDEVAPLVALGGDLAFRLEMARDQIQYCARIMRKYAHVQRVTAEEIAEMASIALSFQQIRIFLAKALQETHEATKEHGFGILGHDQSSANSRG